mmetsp:Transcript_22315/g.46925  ORF Transcript_22315/g.46925 Transcript_22315/m.46925 type:complete len:103 (+) Transcript_22315:160-468(+)
MHTHWAKVELHEHVYNFVIQNGTTLKKAIDSLQQRVPSTIPSAKGSHCWFVVAFAVYIPDESWSSNECCELLLSGSIKKREFRIVSSHVHHALTVHTCMECW